MRNIDRNRLASGAVLCLVIESLGLSFPGSLNSLSSRERILCRIMLDPQVGSGEVTHSPKALTLTDADRGSGILVDLYFHLDAEVGED